MRSKIILLNIVFSLLCIESFSQLDYRLAYDLFKMTNYLDAIPEFKKHLKVDPKDSKALFHLGMCYLNTNLDRSMAIEYLEKCDKDDKADKETKFYLAQALTYKYSYDDAIEMLNKYLESPGKNEEEAKKLIANYEVAKKLYQNPLDVTFTNLGNQINTSYPEYSGYISADMEMLVYTARNEDGKGRKEFDGYYPSDVFVSKYNGFEYKKPKLSGVNTAYDESVVGMKPDGSEIYIYIDNISEVGEIYFSPKTGSMYSKKKKIAEGVNDPKAFETSATFSPDGNTMFFASNRADKENLDLYMTRKLPTGDWAEPQPIAWLNTEGNEDSPMLLADGKTFYFASNKLPGMGGYDIFKCEWDPLSNTFTEPVNIGYPLNTPYDDKTISFNKDGNIAIVSQVRPAEGMGDLDLYKAEINDVEVTPVIIKTSVLDATDNTMVKGKTVIFLFDNAGNIIGEYTSAPGLEIILALKPGKYSIDIESEGYELATEDLNISQFDAEKGFVEKSFTVSK